LDLWKRKCAGRTEAGSQEVLKGLGDILAKVYATGRLEVIATWGLPEADATQTEVSMCSSTTCDQQHITHSSQDRVLHKIVDKKSRQEQIFSSRKSLQLVKVAGDRFRSTREQLTSSASSLPPSWD
jgi:hypothetical protein